MHITQTLPPRAVTQICNHGCFNHWNLKQHILTQHSSIEESMKQKYYREICDMETHMMSKKHNNTKECKIEIDKLKYFTFY